MADVTATIEAVLKDDQFKVGADRIKAEANEASEGAKGAFSKLQENVEKNFVAIAAAATEAYEVIKQSVEAIEIAAKFQEQTDMVQKQFGVTADVIIEKMGEAAKGTISNAELMKLASRAMALGVTNDIDTLAKMMEFAEIQSKVLGKSTEEVFQSMVEGIGKQNPRMLKELGFTKDALKEVGDGAGAAASKSELLELVMGKAEDTIKQFGDKNLSAADKIEGFKAQLDNAKLSLGQSLLPAFEKILPFISGFIKFMDSMPGPLKAAAVAAFALVPALIALNAAAGPIGLLLAAIGGAAVLLIGQYGRMEKASEELAKSQEKLTDQLTRGAFAYSDATINNFTEATKKGTLANLQYFKTLLDKGMYLNQYNKLVEASTEKEKAYAQVQNAIVQQSIILKQKEQADILAMQKKAEADRKSLQLEADKTIKDAAKKNIDAQIDLLNSYIAAYAGNVEKVKQLEDLKNKIISDDRTKISKETEKDQEELSKFLGVKKNEEIAKINEEKDKALAANYDMFKKGKIGWEEYTKNIESINASANIKIASAWAKTLQDIGQKTIKIISNISQTIFNDMQNTINRMQDAINALDAEHNKLMAQRRDEDYTDNKKSLEDKVKDAKKAYDEYSSEENKKALEDAQRALDRLNQDEDYAVKKDALEADMAAKKKDLAIKEWETNKALKISEGIINAAAGTLQGLAMAGIPGAIVAGVMGATEIALIASEPMPAFRKGGVSQGGAAIVGEEGPEIVMLPRGATVIPAGASAALMSGMPSMPGNNSSIMNNSSMSSSADNRQFNFHAHGVQDPLAFINAAKRQFGMKVFEATR